MLPPTKSAGVAPDRRRKLILCQTGTLPQVGNEATVPVGLLERNITEESDDFWELLDTRFALTLLPKLKRIEVYPQSARDFPLL